VCERESECVSESESASRPLIDFGELNDNMCVGLTYLLKIS